MAQIQSLHSQVRDLKMALRRYWARAIVFALVTMALTMGGLLVMPRQYASESKLLVRFGDIPAAAKRAGRMTSIQQARDNELNSLLEGLRSRTLLGSVVDAVGADAIIQGHLPEKVPPVERVSPHIAGHEPEVNPEATRDAKRQRAVYKLEQNLQFSIPKEAGTIAVRGRAETPELAQQIVAALVTLYMDELMKGPTVPGPNEFMRDEKVLAEKHWNEASAALNDAESRFGIVTSAGKRKLLEDQLADVEMQIAREVFKYEAEERRLSAQLAAAHPQLQAIRGVLSDLTKAMQQPASAGKTQLTSQYQESASWPQSLSTLGRQRQQLREELAALNAQQLIIRQLDREAELAGERLAAYAAKAKQASINGQPDQERLMNVSIVQPASYSSKSLGLQSWHVLALGAFVSMFGGVGLAIVCYHFDPLIRTPLELEQFGLPVMGSVPETRGSLDLAV